MGGLNLYIYFEQKKFTFTNLTNSNSLNEILITKKNIKSDKMQIFPNPILFAIILYKICIYIEVHHTQKKKPTNANQLSLDHIKFLYTYNR